MNDLRKAAEQALEALESIKAWYKWKGGPFENVMEALRQALATQVTTQDITQVTMQVATQMAKRKTLVELLDSTPDDAVNMPEECVHKSDKLEQEPVAWINYNAATGEETINRECHSELASTPLYKTPLQNEITCVCGAVWDGKLMTIPPREKKQEPVAWMHPEWRTYTRAPTPCLAPKDGWIPLYTAPPKREWVGLTEDEKQFFKAMGFSGIDIVEAKLKEKNT